jgi:hypothetical protein
MARAAHARLVGGDLGREHPQRAAHQPDNSAGVAAAAAPVELRQASVEHGEVARAASRQVGQLAGNGGQPEHAWPALAADSAARYRAIRAVSVSPQAVAGNAAITPAPGAALTGARPAAENGSCAASGGTQLPE